MLLNSSFCHPAYFLWHFFRLWINVRVKRSLGRRWGDWYWFMAACEALRRVWGSLQELGLYWEAGQPRSSNNNDLCWGWVVIDSCHGGVASLTSDGRRHQPRPGLSLFRPDVRQWSPTLGCRDKQRDGHYIITETFIGQIRKSLLRRRKKDLSIWSL